MRLSQTLGVALLSTVLWGRASFAGDEPSGPDILQKCVAAYKALPGYVGTSKAYRESKVKDDEDADAEIETVKETATARIQYAQPTQFRITGKDSDGRDFVVICNDKNGWVSWALEEKGAFGKQTTSELAIAKMSGVAVRTPSSIFALLTGREWDNPIIQPESAKLSGHEKIDGAECYKVTNTLPFRTDVFWVDSKTFLLRYQRAETEAQLKKGDEMEADTNETFVQDDPATPGCKNRVRTEAFTIESTQAPADKTLFQAPIIGTKPAPQA